MTVTTLDRPARATAAPPAAPAIPAPPAPPARDALGRPEASRWASALAVSAAEALHGARDYTQLDRWLAADVYEILKSRAKVAQRLAATQRGVPPRVTQRSSHCSDLGGGIVHASVLIDEGAARTRAVAIRLEWRRGRWLATQLQFL
jgi:hypothetical protein